MRTVELQHIYIYKKFHIYLKNLQVQRANNENLHICKHASGGTLPGIPSFTKGQDLS